MSWDRFTLLSDQDPEAFEASILLAQRPLGRSVPLENRGPIRSHEELDRVLRRFQTSGIRRLIFHAFRDPELDQALRHFCRLHGLVEQSLLAPLVQAMKEEPLQALPCDSSSASPLYAMDFAHRFDDGRDPKGVFDADLCLIGVSRTMKTPLSLYLASRSYKVINIPLVPETLPPEELFRAGPGKVVGLTAPLSFLLTQRKKRLESLGLPAHAAYAGPQRIQEELSFAEQVMKQIGCPIIDVTDRAVEETADIIIRHLEETRKERSV